MRVSKADGSQVLDLQKDALRSAGVSERHLYSDTASGKKDDRPMHRHFHDDKLSWWGTISNRNMHQNEYNRANP